MRVTCPLCRTDYALPARRIPSRPLRLRCPACGRTFRLEPPERSRAAVADGEAERWARRLARALVSDIVVYHPQRRAQALHADTLMIEFATEIAAAWRGLLEYAGDDPVRLAPVMREALDELLGGGTRVVPGAAPAAGDEDAAP